MPGTSPREDEKHDFWRWVLFVSAAFFMASSIRAGGVVGLLGGLVFPSPARLFSFLISAPAKTFAGAIRGNRPGIRPACSGAAYPTR